MAKNWHCIDCNKLIWNRFKRCKSCAHIGNKNQKGLFKADNPNWRGGIAKNPYRHRFKKLRPFIHARYKVCQYCNDSNDLVVHHLDHNRVNDIVTNLITLCRSCNSRETFYQPYYKTYLSYKIFLKFREATNT